MRAWGDTQLGLENHEPDFLQLKVTAGHVSLDLRTLDGGRTVEVDTPAAAFTIDPPATIASTCARSARSRSSPGAAAARA